MSLFELHLNETREAKELEGMQLTGNMIPN
jgi:hypothetical protein